jgi:Ni/Co efflux regulator RcnB
MTAVFTATGFGRHRPTEFRKNGTTSIFDGNIRPAACRLLAAIGFFMTVAVHPEQGAFMYARKQLARLTLAALCAASLPAFAEDTSVTLDRPGVGMHEIKEGDKAPDEYKREALALKDWQKRHLSAPKENEQWVEIKDQYVLVNIPNGTIVEMKPKAAAHK